MSLLAPPAIRTYKPFGYPWCYEAWLMQNRIAWLPEEVPMGEDVKDFREKLSDSERNLITQIFRFFVTADIDVGGAYLERYLPLFQPTEVRMMLIALWLWKPFT